jgi:hypothetical protein
MPPIFSASPPDRIIRSGKPRPHERIQIADRPLPPPSPRSIIVQAWLDGG